MKAVRMLAAATLIFAILAPAMGALAAAGALTREKADAYAPVLASKDNMVANASFESAIDGWMTYGPSGSLAWGSEPATAFGDNAASILGAGDFDLLFQEFSNIELGVLYYAMAWVKTDIKTKNCSARIVLAGFGAAGDVTKYLYSNNQTGKKDWTFHVLSMKPDKTVVKIGFQACCLGSWGPDDTALFDGFALVRADKLDAAMVAALKK